MKAATYQNYGSASVLQIEDVARPSIADNEVLVQVYNAPVTTADWRLRASAFPGFTWLPGRLMFGLFAPRNKILGTDFSGRIVAKGKDVTHFKGGDEVFGFSGKGAHAEYLAISQDGAIVRKPSNLDYDEAAAVPFGALSALVFLRDLAKINRGEKILILGASGGVGVFAVQLAKHFGAEVTGVSSTANLALVKSLGADHVIDYTTEDFTKSGKTYDIIFDTIGKTTYSQSRRALTPQGRFVPLNIGMRELFQSLTTSLTRGRKVVIGISGDTKEDLAFISQLLERGEIRPVIDGSYPLAQIANAHRRVESRHKTGAVVITIGQRDVLGLAAE